MSNVLALEEILDAIEEVPEVKSRLFELSVDTSPAPKERARTKQRDEKPFNWPPCDC